MAMRPDLVDLATVKRLPRNPKLHDLGTLHTSYDRFAFLERILINETTGHLLAGHGRVDALQQRKAGGQQPPGNVEVGAGGAWLVPADWVSVPEADEEAAAIALNRLTETGGWDETRLAQVLADLATEPQGLVATGFDEEDIDQLLRDLGQMPEPVEDPGAQVDKAEELREKWDVRLGQVWEIGKHRLICGDCREPETWRQLLVAAGVEKVDGIFTSPPYAEQRKAQYSGVPVPEYVDWWEMVQANARTYLADDGSFFVNIKPHCKKGERVLYVFDLVLAMKRRWDWRLIDELCRLVQTTPGKWPNRFKNGFEPVYQFSLGRCKFRPSNVSWKGETFKANGKTHYDGKSAIRGITDRFMGQVLPSNVIEARAGEGMHPAVFSVTLPDFFIRAYSDPGDVWLDPFLGSGTVLVAAHKNDRRGLGIELLEKYCAVAIERLVGMGLEARMVGTV